MPKVNVYLPSDLAQAVATAGVPVSAICQAALEQAVRDVASLQATDEPPAGAWTGLYGRFTPRARRSIVLAQEIARRVPHDYLGTEHVLSGIAEEGDNVGNRALQRLGVSTDDLLTELSRSIPPATRRVEGHLPFTPRAKSIMEMAAKEAQTFGHNYVGCEHLLLGTLAVEDGIGSKVLRRLGVEPTSARRAITAELTAVAQQGPARQATPLGPDRATPTDTELILERLQAIEDRLDELER